MFISREQVKQMTGYDITAETLAQAQTIIEVWVGKAEAEVDDAADLMQLGRATAFQAVYMQSNPKVVLEQIALHKITTGDTTYDMNAEFFAPFIAPWAWQACRRLSWMRSRSVKTGPVFDTPSGSDEWRFA